MTREFIKQLRERNVDDGHVIHLNRYYGHSIHTVNSKPKLGKDKYLCQNSQAVKNGVASQGRNRRWQPRNGCDDVNANKD